MAAFKFRLATILKLREATQDERRRELAEAYHVDEVLAGREQGIDAQLEHLRQQCRMASRVGTVDVDTLVVAGRHELMLRAQLRDLARQREHVAAEIEQRRERLVEATQAVRALEKLREKQLAQHEEEEQRLADKEMDEVGVRRWRPQEVEA